MRVLKRNGEYQDIFYTILVTNWMMGLVVLTFVPFFLKRVFRISFKKLLPAQLFISQIPFTSFRQRKRCIEKTIIT